KLVKSTLLPIGSGLLIAQLIATGFVYLSNLDVHQMVLAAKASGYVAIPHGEAAADLTAWRAAIWGGLFYTLSIGVGLTLATWALWHLWTLVFRQNKRLILVMIGLWAAVLVTANLNGPVLFPSLFCVLVPLGTLGCLYYFGPIPSGHSRHLWMVPAVTLGLLTAIWATQLNQNLFIAIRDHLLLSNPAGRAVNDFYYRYTLFAAQCFKSVYQKTLRTYHLEGDIDESETIKLKTRLLRLDMLHLPQLNKPDMTIGISKTTVVLSDRHGRSSEGELTSFLKNPGKFLKSFSHASDRYRPLRRMTLYGLLVGFPILLFVSVYTVVRIGMELLFIRGFGRSDMHTTIAASLVCLIIGIALYWPMHTGSTGPLSNESLPDALTADAWPMRVAALRHIEKQGLELADYPQYKTLLTSEMPVERYWLARALAVSRSFSTFTDLISLVEDRHPNVQCQVYYALGKRGSRKAIQTIKAQMFVSDHWYTQWYGYRALRRLGWHQAQSD
ncbi:MAG: HEAT repeat domain-containing protein, partial [Desulfobacteraceae bacterium]